MKYSWLLIFGISVFFFCSNCQGYSQNENNRQSQVNQTPVRRIKRQTDIGQRILGQVNNALCRFGLTRCTSNPNSKKGCKTPSCFHAASEILASLDTTVKPCDNFYKFACGNFIKSKVIPDDGASVSPFTDVADEIQTQLLTILEENSQPNEPKPFALAKNLYKVCMDEAKIEKNGIQGLLVDLKTIGSWPILEGDSWKSSSFNWKSSIYKCRELGYTIHIFNAIRIETDAKNVSKRIIAINQPGLGLSRALLVNGVDNKIVKEYYNFMVDIAIIFGAQRDTAEKDMLETIKFMVNLASITLTAEESKKLSNLYNPMTLKQMEEKYPHINWTTYINNLLKPAIKFESSEIINVVAPSYLQKFETLIDQTPIKTRANYFMWRIVELTLPYLTKVVRNRQLQLLKIISGQTQRPPRSEECLQITSGLITHGLDALYLNRYFDAESKKSVDQLVKDIRQSFKKVLQNVKWMDKNTKKNALKKAMAMSFNIAYADEYLDIKKVTEYYNNLVITTEDYQKALLNVTLNNYDSRYEFLRRPVSKTDWTTRKRPTQVDSSYTYTENSINLSAGILQKSFFNNTRPRYMNYGAIGWIIGHDIIHAIDAKGRQYDIEGNLVDWWDSKSENNYNSKSKCIIDQYANYSFEGLNLNSIGTQEEDIADNGGIKEAYQAYKTSVKRKGAGPRLPGLNYSQSQLFWISAAQVWCEKMRPEAMMNFISTSNRSPPEFRVLGTFSNMPQFAKDFKCKVGTPMNPKNKCSIW